MRKKKLTCSPARPGIPAAPGRPSNPILPSSPSTPYNKMTRQILKKKTIIDRTATIFIHLM